MNISAPTTKRNLRSLQRLALASILVLIPCQTAVPQITRILAFGDSQTDTGNIFDISGGTIGGSPHWEGRFSNGPVWVEHLADYLSVPRPTPSRLGGTNAAYGGAPTGYGALLDTRQDNIEVPRVGLQIDQILAEHVLGPQDLVVVWAGPNDLDPRLPGGPLTPAQIVANLTDHVTTLNNAGANKFLLANLFVGAAPSASEFNSLWAARVNELRRTLPADLYFLDYQAFIDKFVSRPADYGFVPDYNPIIDRPDVNPDQYVIWDQNGHGTTAWHRVIAAEALESLAVVYGDYNGNGLVEQADLDLVLLNWGKPANHNLLVSVGWTNDPATRPLIDQDDLDRVLRNWGKKSLVPNMPSTAAAIPEPASVVLLVCSFTSCAAAVALRPKGQL